MTVKVLNGKKFSYVYALKGETLEFYFKSPPATRLVEDSDNFAVAKSGKSVFLIKKSDSSPSVLSLNRCEKVKIFDFDSNGQKEILCFLKIEDKTFVPAGVVFDYNQNRFVVDNLYLKKWVWKNLDLKRGDTYLALAFFHYSTGNYQKAEEILFKVKPEIATKKLEEFENILSGKFFDKIPVNVFRKKVYFNITLKSAVISEKNGQNQYWDKRFDYPDVFVKFEINGREFKTPVVENSLNPVWNYSFKSYVFPFSTFTITVYEHDSLSDTKVAVKRVKILKEFQTIFQNRPVDIKTSLRFVRNFTLHFTPVPL